VERQTQISSQPSRKFQIRIGLSAAQAVVKVGGMQHEAKFSAALCEGAQQGHRVRAARDANGQSQPGLEQRGVERQRVGNRGAHQKNHTGRGVTPDRRAMYTSPVMQVFVILPAAGLGTRMAGPQPKQFVSLDGLPILIHSLRAFASVERVTAIYVAVRKPEIERVEAQIVEYGLDLRVKVVEGGDNRQESVSHALAALPARPDDIVLVHDAVRPLIDAATIDRTIDAVELHGAAIVGLPAVDTIKQVERTAHGALVVSTIPREFVVLAQTPQGFRFDLLREAFAEATADGFIGTDEASVVERAGHPVAVVHGSQVNLKITQAGDLELAEFYLRQRAR
jgi:2-C-methyl-D-erythritol 4-phosphate cytidylyltransferase